MVGIFPVLGLGVFPWVHFRTFSATPEKPRQFAKCLISLIRRVVVVIFVCLDISQKLQIPRDPTQLRKDPTPKKVLYAKSASSSDMS